MTGKDTIEIQQSGESFRAFIFSSGVETLDIGAFRDGVVVDYGDRELPGILLGNVHAPANTPGDADDAPLGLGRVELVGSVWLLLHTLPDADGALLDKVFIPSGCLHEIGHQGIDFVLDHGVKRLLCCHCWNLLPQNAKRATPENSGIALSAWFRIWLLDGFYIFRMV